MMIFFIFPDYILSFPVCTFYLLRFHFKHIPTLNKKISIDVKSIFFVMF